MRKVLIILAVTIAFASVAVGQTNSCLESPSLAQQCRDYSRVLVIWNQTLRSQTAKIVRVLESLENGSARLSTASGVFRSAKSAEAVAFTRFSKRRVPVPLQWIKSRTDEMHRLFQNATSFMTKAAAASSTGDLERGNRYLFQLDALAKKFNQELTEYREELDALRARRDQESAVSSEKPATTSVSAQRAKAITSLPAVPGYRFPVTADVKEQWSQKYWDEECRKAKKGEQDEDEATQGARVEFACRRLNFPVHSALGDYNGDGVQDEARILILMKDSTEGHIVFFLKSKTGGVKVVKDVFSFYPIRGHYIETIKPSGGKILTRCGLAESECDSPWDLKSITLKLDGLAIRAFEGHDVILYWDSRLNGFKSIEQ